MLYTLSYTVNTTTIYGKLQDKYSAFIGNYVEMQLGTPYANRTVNRNDRREQEINMKWLEIVRMRSSEAGITAAWSSLEDAVRKVKKEEGLDEAFILQHAMYNGDLAIVLIWDNERCPVKTQEGILLAEQSKRHGSVEHAIWIPATIGAPTTVAAQAPPEHSQRRTT